MRTRPTSRIVLLNERNQVLLICYKDLSSTASSSTASSSTVSSSTVSRGSRFWVTPGGGLEPGETYEQAAIRELLEETGIEVSDVGKPIWTRQKVVDGVLFLEQHFLVRCAGFDVIVKDNPDAAEHALTLGLRWWNVQQLPETTETIYPEDLALHLEPILRDVIPATPIDITRAELV